MILHTPLYNFCNGNLYNENIVVIRKEFNEISFFNNKHEWKDIKKFIKAIKSGSAIKLDDYITTEAMTEEEKQEFVNNFKNNILQDIINNGLTPKYMKDKITFMWQGNAYETKISFLIALFNLHRYNSVEDLSPVSFSYNVRTAITTIPVKNKEGKIVTIQIQNRMSDILLQNLKEEFKMYKTIINTLMEYICNYKFTDEESVRTFYNAVYGIDIYDENFKYQDYYLPRVKM